MKISNKFYLAFILWGFYLLFVLVPLHLVFCCLLQSLAIITLLLQNHKLFLHLHTKPLVKGRRLRTLHFLANRALPLQV
jgi:hypothetical protein